MRRPLRFAAWMACAALLLTAGRAAAQANTEASAQAQEKTLLTFSAPVRVPGTTLPAGEYIFRLANPSDDQQTVEILKKDGAPVARVVTAPLSRPEGNTSAVLMFGAASGQAPAVRAWFYPGTVPGHEFVYSRDEARSIAHDANVDVLAADLPPADGGKVTIVRMTSQGYEQTYSQNAGQIGSSQASSSSSAVMIPYSSSESSGSASSGQMTGTTHAAGTSGTAGTTGSVGTTGSAGTSGAIGTTGATSATGATIEHSGATSATQPSTSGQTSASGGSTSASGGEKDEHLNQARSEQNREASKYLDRANSLLAGAVAQNSGGIRAQMQQLQSEVDALRRAYEPQQRGSSVKDPDLRNWEEQYRLVMKDLSKVSNQAAATSGRVGESPSSEMGGAERSAASSSPDDTLEQVRMNLQRFHDIATGKSSSGKKK